MDTGQKRGYLIKASGKKALMKSFIAKTQRISIFHVQKFVYDL